MSKILGVNGIHNWSWGTDSFTDRLIKYLKEDDHEVVDVQYPRMLALLAYFQSQIDSRVKCLLKVCQPGDVVVAHSFGCLLTLRAMELGAEFSTVFFFGAAAEADSVIAPNGCEKLYNIYSYSDNALSLGRILPGHPFGDLGKVGYTGDDKRVRNVAAPGYDHNTYADEHHIKHWVEFINERIPGISGMQPPQRQQS